MRRSKWFAAVALSAAALVLGASVALADTVTVNDLVTGGNVTKSPGSTGSAKVTLLTTNNTPTGDQVGCNAQTSNPVVVTLSSNNAEVTFPSGNTASLTDCDPQAGSSQNVPYAVSSSASGSATISISNVTGGKTDGVRLFNTADTLVITISAPSDTTAPSWECDPAAADGNWHATNQSFACTASDTSGLKAGSPASFTLSTNVAAGAFDANASTNSQLLCDIHDNCTTAGPITGNMIDRQKPVTSVTGVSNGATYTLGSVPTAGCSSTDGGSGLATEATPSSSGGPVGSVTTTCSGATDNVGNVADNAQVIYNVIFDWDGFFRPVDNPTVINTVKAGSAVPVKFSLDGNQGLSIFASGWPTSQQVASPGADATLDAIEATVTAGQSSLQYDATSDTYTYVWKTNKDWAGTYRQLVVKLADGTVHRANFKLTR